MVGKILVYILFSFFEVLVTQGKPTTTSEQRRASGKPWGTSWHEVTRCSAEELRVIARIKVSWKTCKPCRIFSFCRGCYNSGWIH